MYLILSLVAQKIISLINVGLGSMQRDLVLFRFGMFTKPLSYRQNTIF